MRPHRALTISLLILSGALFLLAGRMSAAKGAVAFSHGYIVNGAGGLAETQFIVSPSSYGEAVSVKLYFSDPNLAKYFAMRSDGPSWNGVNGFTSLKDTESFYLQSLPTLSENDSLTFVPSEIQVEIGNGLVYENKTVEFFPLPGKFYSAGRSPPPGIAVTQGTRQVLANVSGSILPLEVSIQVW